MSRDALDKQFREGMKDVMYAYRRRDIGGKPEDVREAEEKLAKYEFDVEEEKAKEKQTREYWAEQQETQEQAQEQAQVEYQKQQEQVQKDAEAEWKANHVQVGPDEWLTREDYDNLPRSWKIAMKQGIKLGRPHFSDAGRDLRTRQKFTYKQLVVFNGGKLETPEETRANELDLAHMEPEEISSLAQIATSREVKAHLRGLVSRATKGQTELSPGYIGTGPSPRWPESVSTKLTGATEVGPSEIRQMPGRWPESTSLYLTGKTSKFQSPTSLAKPVYASDGSEIKPTGQEYIAAYIAQYNEVPPDAELKASGLQPTQENIASLEAQIDRRKFESEREQHGGVWWTPEEWKSIPEEGQIIAREKGFDALRKWATDRAESFEREYAKLASGEWVDKKILDALNPKMRAEVLAKGISAIDISGLKPIWQFKKMQEWGLIAPDAEFEGTDNEGNILIKGKTWIDNLWEKHLKDADVMFSDFERFKAEILPERLKELPEETKAMINDPERREFLKGLAIGAIPIAGTVYFWRAMKPWERGFSAVADVATFVPFVGMVSSGVRTAARVGVSMPKAIAIATGRALIAEIKAPITSILHPIETAKTIFYPIETILRKSKVPLTSVELRFNTVKIPVQDLKNPSNAMAVRDELTDLAIKGKGATIVKEGQEISLAPTALQQVVGPAAVHATPDIRPFLTGTVVQEGMEGGLFLSPTLSSRFTLRSAFGLKPKGSIPGAIIITDERILAKMQSSGKIYRGAVEMEKVLPAGIELPPPSQILMTRDMGGRELQLAIIGKPLTESQVKALKLIGSKDVVTDIFRPAYTIKGESAISKMFDRFTETVEESRKLEKEIEVAKKTGKTRELSKMENELDALRAETSNLARRLDREAATRTPLRAIGISAGDYIDTNTYRYWAENNPEMLARFAANIPEADRRMILNSLDQRERLRVDERIRVAPRAQPTRGIVRMAPEREPPRLEPEREPVRGMPEREPYRLPARIGARGIPEAPERGIVRTGIEIPTRVTALRRETMPRTARVIEPLMPPKTPRPPRFSGIQAFEQLTKEQKLASVAWKQGWCYHLIYPPYGSNNVLHSFKPFPGVKVSSGPESAYKSVAKIRGAELPDVISRDMGIMDLTFTKEKKGNRVVIAYKPDVLQDSAAPPPVNFPKTRVTTRRKSRRTSTGFGAIRL